MSSAEYNNLSKRLDQLMGLFFDGVLNENEDQELASILRANQTFATRFLDHINIERTLVGVASGGLANDGFISSVKRKAVRSADNCFESNFAKSVINKIKKASPQKNNRRKPRASIRRASIRRARSTTSASTSFFPVAVLITAAMLMLGVFISFSNHTDNANQMSQAYPKTSTPSISNETDGSARNNALTSKENSNANRPEVSPRSSEQELGLHLPNDVRQERRINNDTHHEHIEGPLVEGRNAGQSSEGVAALGDKNNIVDLAPKIIASTVIVGDIKATWVRASDHVAGGQVTKSDQIFNGDRIQIAGTTNPKALPAWVDGVQVALSESASLLAKPGAIIRFELINGKIVPQLEQGTCFLRIDEKAKDTTCSITSLKDAKVVVSGGLCSVSRNVALEWVLVSVLQGRAQVFGKGSEQVVLKNFGCLIKFGAPPGKPFLQRLSNITGYSERSRNDSNDTGSKAGNGLNSGGEGVGTGSNKGQGSNSGEKGNGKNNGKGQGKSGNNPGVGSGNGGGRPSNNGGGASGGNGKSKGSKGSGGAAGNRGGGASGGNRGGSSNGGNRGGGASGGNRGGASGGKSGGGNRGRGKAGRF